MQSIEQITKEKGVSWVEWQREIVESEYGRTNDGKIPSPKYVNSRIRQAYSLEKREGTNKRSV